MIRLLLISFIYLSDFSHVNSLQFTGRGFCAATDGGVLVYDEFKGIVSSYIFKDVAFASTDINSGEIAFITKNGVLYVYSPFFETLKRIGIAGNVAGMGFSSGIIMLLYPDGRKRYISKFNQPAVAIYIDTIFQTRKREFPLYLKTRVYENSCHIFSEPSCYARGYDNDFVGTKSNGIYIFDRRVKKLKKVIYSNIRPPVYKLGIVFDTLYVLHAGGITRISGDYVSSLSTDCFQYGYQPVDFIYGENSTLLLNKNGFYTLEDPYFFTPLSQNCGDAVTSFNTETFPFIVCRKCILSLNEQGKTQVIYTTQGEIDYAGYKGGKIYILENERLYIIKDSVKEEIDYENEPVLAHYMVQGYDKLYVPAKRGLFEISDKGVSLIKSPFNLMYTRSGVSGDNFLYLALSDKILKYSFVNKTWSICDFGKTDLKGITAVVEFDGRVYAGYADGVAVK